MQKPKKQPLIGVFSLNNSRFELYDAQVSKFPVFVYQLVSGEMAHVTDKFTFVVKSTGGKN